MDLANDSLWDTTSLLVFLVLAALVVVFTATLGGAILGLILLAVVVFVVWALFKRLANWFVHGKRPRLRSGGDA